MTRKRESTADLDQTNLAFVRLRLYAGLQDWAAILTDQDLQHILAMRRGYTTEVGARNRSQGSKLSQASPSAPASEQPDQAEAAE